jgi:hypothetical protein
MFFVIEYAKREGVTTRVEEFTEDQRSEALRRRFALEAANREDPNIEVVVLGAESEHDVKQTHARYFSSVGELLSAQEHLAIA